MHNDITGVILAGGASSRMKTEKAFLKFENSDFIQQAANLMCSVFKEVIIITNTPDKYKFLNLLIFEDIYKKKGPLAGIHSALSNSNTDRIFIIPCDMPFISAKFINSIIDYPTKLPVVICKTKNFIHAQIGIYSKEILPLIETILNNSNSKDKKKSKILEIERYIKIEKIEASEISCFREDLFFNVNTPEDYQEFLTKKKQNF